MLTIILIQDFVDSLFNYQCHIFTSFHKILHICVYTFSSEYLQPETYENYKITSDTNENRN